MIMHATCALSAITAQRLDQLKILFLVQSAHIEMQQELFQLMNVGYVQKRHFCRLGAKFVLPCDSGYYCPSGSEVQ